MIDPKLKKWLEEENGYFDLIEIPERGICALLRFAFTVAIVYGIDEVGYVGRYCYHGVAEAREALKVWDGKGDPSGDWIKHKGHMEYSNPNTKEETKEEKLKRLKQSFGTIQSNVYLSAEDLSRENLYDDDGR